MAMAPDQGAPVPRTILAFYDSQLDGEPSLTEVHKSAEMPLNHLGLVVQYQDIHAPLPDRESMLVVRGILLWVYWDSMPAPNQFLKWLIDQMKSGKRVVVMGSHAFENNRVAGRNNVDPDLLQEFWAQLGLSTTSEWLSAPFDIELKQVGRKIIGFERSLGSVLPTFPRKTKTDRIADSYLQAVRASSQEVLAELIVIGPKGAYVAPGYSLIYTAGNRYRYWYLNPFYFFRAAFFTDDVPKADTTTLSGRRIYYSHVDGDGWRSLSKVPGYRGKNISVTEVLLHEILLKYPDLPVTIAPVAADLDARLFGTKDSQRLAREIFSLPNVEAGSHTMTHPLQWGFFENYSQEKERLYTNAYPALPGDGSLGARIKTYFGYGGENKDVLHDSSLALTKRKMNKGHEQPADIPRAYYNGPFDIVNEIQGSVAIIQQYLPQGKKVEVLQWSGDCAPYPDAVRQSRLAGLRNLNGGDTRLDREFDSLVWVSPIGREVGGERQIYASSSNENTYTNLWQSRYFGYSYLEKTLRRTETPRRIKPLNIYYHTYSAERLASLNALRKAMTYAQEQSIAPVSASQYAAIADGFFNIKLVHTGQRQWRIMNRGQLDTIRFDQATYDAVDFNRSSGVLGQLHLHGSLYVHLDPVVDTPVIALEKIDASDNVPHAKRPYLISGRWRVEGMEVSRHGFDFYVQGYGAGNMVWYVPERGTYQVSVVRGTKKVTDRAVQVSIDHRLTIELDQAPDSQSHVRVTALKQ